MDPLSDILTLLQPRTYATGGLSAGGDWGISFPAHGMIKCYSVVRGECWINVENTAEPMRLQAGSCLLLPRGLPFSLNSDPSQPLMSWEVLSQRERHDAIVALTQGDDFLILGSHFKLEGDARFLLDALPPVVLLETKAQRETLRWAVDRLLQEVRDPQSGSSLMAQQIAYAMLIEALRLHVAKGIGKDPGWLAALKDVRLRAALSSIHHEPARAWTLAGLAHTGHVAYRIRAAVQAEGRQVAHGIPDALAYDAGRKTSERSKGADLFHSSCGWL